MVSGILSPFSDIIGTIFSNTYGIGPIDWSLRSTTDAYKISEQIIPSIPAGTHNCDVHLWNDVSSKLLQIVIDVCSSILSIPLLPIVEPYSEFQLGIKTSLTFHFSGAPINVSFKNITGMEVLSPTMCFSLSACKQFVIDVRHNQTLVMEKPIMTASNCHGETFENHKDFILPAFITAIWEVVALQQLSTDLYVYSKIIPYIPMVTLFSNERLIYQAEVPTNLPDRYRILPREQYRVHKMDTFHIEPGNHTITISIRDVNSQFNPFIKEVVHT